MARKTIVQRIALDGGKQIEAEFKQLGAAGEKAFADLKRAADRLNNISPLALRIQQLRTQFQAVKTAGSDFASAVGTVAQRVGILTAAVGAAGGAFALFAKKGADAGAELDDFSQKVGVAAEDLQALQGAARVQGTGPEALQKALVKLADDLSGTGKTAAEATKQIADGFISAGGAISEFGSGAKQAYDLADGAKVNVTRFGDAASDALKQVKAASTSLTQFGSGAKQTYETIDGASVSITRFGEQATAAVKQLQATANDSDKAAAAYKRLGISLDGLKAKGGSAGDLLLQVADGFSRLEDSAEKTAIATALFGERIGPNLIPFLNEGRAGVEKYRETLKKAGLDITNSGAKASGEFGDSIDKLVSILGDFQLKVGTLFAPLGTRLFQGLITAFENFAPQLVALAESAVSKAMPYIEALMMLLSGETLRFDDSPALQSAYNSLLQIQNVAKSIGQTVTTAWNGIVDALTLLEKAAGGVAAAINGVFGTEATGASLLFFVAVTRLLGGFAALVKGGGLLIAMLKFLGPALVTVLTVIGGMSAPFAIIGAALIALGTIVVVFWDDFKKLAADAILFVQGLAGSVGDVIAAGFELASRTIAGIWEFIKRVAAAAIGFVKEKASTVGGGISSAFQTAADTFAAVWDTIKETASTAVQFIKDKAGTLSDAISGGFSTAAETVSKIWDSIKETSQKAVDFIGEKAGTFGGSIAAAFQKAADTITAIWASIKATAQAAVDAIVGNFKAGIDRLGGFIDGVLNKLKNGIEAIKSFFSLGAAASPGETPIQGGVGQENVFGGSGNDTLGAPGVDYTTAIASTQEAFTQVKTIAQEAFNVINAAAQVLGEAIRGFIVGAFDTVVQATATAQASIQTAADAMVAALERVIAKAQEAVQATSQASGISPSGPGFAAGGYVRGPGTSTSDSISAPWLSDGEYVVRAAAVKRYGVEFLHRLNGLRLAVPNLRDGIMGFAMGGLVGPGPLPALASASSSAQGRPVNLTIGAETFAGLIAPADVADKLTRFASRRVVASAGRRPSWVGG